MPQEVTMTWEYEFDLAITPKTPGGDPAPVDGDAIWETDGPGLTVSSTGPLTATAKGIEGSDGDVIVTVTADADMGAGFVPIKDTCLVHVQTPMATNLGMTVSEPRLQQP